MQMFAFTLCVLFYSIRKEQMVPVALGVVHLYIGTYYRGCIVSVVDHTKTEG